MTDKILGSGGELEGGRIGLEQGLVGHRGPLLRVTGARGCERQYASPLSPPAPLQLTADQEGQIRVNANAMAQPTGESLTGGMKRTRNVTAGTESKQNQCARPRHHLSSFQLDRWPWGLDPPSPLWSG